MSQESLHEYGEQMVRGTWHRKQPAEQPDKHSYKWILGEKFVMAQFENADKPNLLVLLGIDPSTNERAWFAFGDDGSVAITPIAVAAVGEGSQQYSATVNGQTMKGVQTFSEDRLEVDVTIDGEAKPKAVWEPSEEVSDLSWFFTDPPEEIPAGLEVVSNITGPKWVSGNNPAGEMIGITEGSWILDGKFFLYSASGIYAGQEFGSHILVFGIDPDTGDAKAWGFTDNGTISSFKIDGMSLSSKMIGGLTGETKAFQGTFEQVENFVRITGTSGDDPVEYKYYDVKR